jgi:two-component system chemotaxis response regulator CheY
MKRVLIVDDAAFVRLHIRKILEGNGFDVVGEAIDGFEAIKQYEKLKPDIVTMDINMPEMDGVQALYEIKKQDPDAKVVMISALGHEVWVKKAMMFGAKGFIVKPFEGEYVLNTLKNV